MESANQELYHYGVLGMKWGIRRTPEQLGRRVTNLTKKNRKIQSNKVDKANVKAATIDQKASKVKMKAAKKRAYATSKTDIGKAQDLEFKAAKLSLKSDRFKAMAAKGERAIHRNEELIRVYNKTIDALESGKIKQGESFIENFFMKYED